MKACLPVQDVLLAKSCSIRRTRLLITALPVKSFLQVRIDRHGVFWILEFLCLMLGSVYEVVATPVAKRLPEPFIWVSNAIASKIIQEVGVAAPFGGAGH